MSLRRWIAGFRRENREIRALFRENSWQTCAALWLDRLLRRRRHRTVRVRGVTLQVRSLSPDVSVALESLGGELSCLERAYPRETRGFIVDAGGYIGTAAVAMSRMYPEATIISIEPSSDNFALLCHNTRAFPNIQPVNAALVPIGGPEQVSLGDRGTGEWGFTIVGSASDHEVRAMESVRAVAIDQVTRSRDGGRLMFVKMDIEGAEVDILESLGALLDDIPILVIELHERIVPGCEALFMSRCADRFVFRLEGEKFVAVSAAFLRSRAAIASSRSPA